MESGNVFSFIGRVIFIALFDNARMLTITINPKIMNVDSLPNSRYFFFIVLPFKDTDCCYRGIHFITISVMIISCYFSFFYLTMFISRPLF